MQSGAAMRRGPPAFRRRIQEGATRPGRGNEGTRAGATKRQFREGRSLPFPDPFRDLAWIVVFSFVSVYGAFFEEVA